MSTISDKLWRCDWTFIILCALACFLLGVVATLAMCNTRSHQSELVTTTRLAPRAAQQPIRIAAAVDSRQHASVPIAAATVRGAPSKPTTYATPVKGTYRNYTVQSGQTLSRLDPEGWQHTCEINKQFGSIPLAQGCKIVAGKVILLPVMQEGIARVALAEDFERRLSLLETKVAELRAKAGDRLTDTA